MTDMDRGLIKSCLWSVTCRKRADLHLTKVNFTHLELFWRASSNLTLRKTFDQFRLESLNRVQVNPVDLKVIPGDTESRSSGFTFQMLSISQFENTTVVWMYIHRKRLRFYQLVKSHCATDVFSGFHAKKCFPQPANDVCNMICNRLLDIFGWDSLPRIFLQHLN